MDYLISHGLRKIANYDEAGQEIKQNVKGCRVKSVASASQWAAIRAHCIYLL